MKKGILILAAVLMGRGGWAESSGAAFLKIDPSVRNQALGGAQPAYSFGAQAVGSNPANVGIMKRPGEVTASFGALQGDSAYGFVAGAFKTKKRAYAMSVTQWSSGSMESRDMTGARTGSFTARDMAIGATASQKVGKIRVGGTVKAIQSTLGDYDSGWTPAVDGGVSLIHKKTLWGLSVANLGAGLKYRSETDKLPAVINGGGAVNLGNITLIAGATHKLVEKETVASLGMEYELGALNLRLGYKSETAKNLALKSHDGGYQAISGLAMGVGVAVRDFKIDYAVNTAAAEWGMTHRVGVTWLWGNAPVKKGPARNVRGNVGGNVRRPVRAVR